MYITVDGKFFYFIITI